MRTLFLIFDSPTELKAGILSYMSRIFIGTKDKRA